MHQVQTTAFGAPEVLRLIEKPDPQPGPDQVVVATEAAGVTFVETQIRAGRPPQGVARPTLPLVLGNAVEGRITAVGSTVDARVLGSRVVTATGGQTIGKTILVPDE
jgi:NADPH:quinone reductase